VTHQEELLAEVRADPEYRWAADAIVALSDQNRARVQWGSWCDECGESWAHAVTCEQNVERRREGENRG
jgi:hypothetical protein